MCEFCSIGPNNTNRNRDSTHPDYSGFFSSTAIDEAIRLAQKLQEQDQNIENRGRDNSSNSDASEYGEDGLDEIEAIEEDDDGT
jgi:hypothetical protein